MPHVIAPDDRYLSVLGHAVAAGEVVELSDEDAESLGWKHATKADVAKAAKAAKTEADSAEDPEPTNTEDGDA